MLYLVKYQKKNVYGDGWKSEERYAIGNSCKEAVDFLKDRLYINLDNESLFKDFNAIPVSKYNDLGEFKAYEVKYEDWNDSFSGTIRRSLLSVGRCPEEAICYTKARVSSDAMHFSAEEIVKICGHRVRID